MKLFLAQNKSFKNTCPKVWWFRIRGIHLFTKQRTVMQTLQVIKDHAALIIANGGPKNRNEQEVMTIFNRLTGNGAANAGKRTKKNHNNNW